jgi:hypothetical protein
MATDRRGKVLRLCETHQAVESIIKHSGHRKHDIGGNVQGGDSVAGVLNLIRVPWTPLRVWEIYGPPFSEKCI